MDSEDGELFIKQLATFVRTHEKALANAAQPRRQITPRHGASQSVSAITPPKSPASIPERPSTAASSSALATAWSIPLGIFSSSPKAAKLSLTPHHLFYLLSRFEELSIEVGPMKIRLENLHDTTTATNYVSFLSSSQRTKSRSSDVGSIRSVSSVRTVMSSMSALWSGFGIGSSITAARTERQKAALATDMKYLYSAFTKIPCLTLAPDWKAKLIRGYEEFPFDSAVPLYVFKNLQFLDISGIDYRQFFGWDRLAEQLRTLTLKRANIDDPGEILIDIVLDDMDRRRRRSSKTQHSPTGAYAHASSPRRSPVVRQGDLNRTSSVSGSPDPRRASVGDIMVGSLSNESVESTSLRNSRRPSVIRIETDDPKLVSKSGRPRSHSPTRPISSRHHTTIGRSSHKVRRSGSGSSQSSLSDSWYNPRNSASALMPVDILPASKWRFLTHLSLAENSLTVITSESLSPLANTLRSLDISENLFTQIPDSLATLTALQALNLSQCMIDSLNSLVRNPLPAISALNLRANRLQSIAGIEKLYPLLRLDLRDNRLTDPMELARLTGIPEIREIWVEGNPFTKTHRDYRITIFNLFRKTPGYMEDIVIDASPPTYSEKRYLVDRVAIPDAVPVVRPPAPEFPAVDVSKPVVVTVPREPTVLRKERPVRPSPKAVASEANTNSTRRRRAPKRRIVDLSTNESGVKPTPNTEAQSQDIPSAAASSDNYRISQSPKTTTRQPSSTMSPARTANGTADPTDVPRINTNIVSPLTAMSGNATPGSWTDKDWNLDGEAYRQKIEALRDKVGNGYLSVVNEESWGASQPGPFLPVDYNSISNIHPSPVMARTPSAQTVHGSRMLG